MFAPPPNLAGFTQFLTNTLPEAKGAGGPILPSQDVQQTALCEALETVNDYLCLVAPTQYVEAVYNYAANQALYLAQDAQGQTYFADLRKTFKMGIASVGVVQSAANSGSSVGQVSAASIRDFTLAEIALLKTPYGQRYLQIAQQFGSELFGVT